MFEEDQALVDLVPLKRCLQCDQKYFSPSVRLIQYCSRCDLRLVNVQRPPPPSSHETYHFTRFRR